MVAPEPPLRHVFAAPPAAVHESALLPALLFRGYPSFQLGRWFSSLGLSTDSCTTTVFLGEKLTLQQPDRIVNLDTDLERPLIEPFTIGCLFRSSLLESHIGTWGRAEALAGGVGLANAPWLAALLSQIAHAV